MPRESVRTAARTRAASPSRVEVDKTAAPVVILTRVENLDIEHVDMAPSSGLATMGWENWAMSTPILASGGVMRAVAFLFLRR